MSQFLLRSTRGDILQTSPGLSRNAKLYDPSPPARSLPCPFSPGRQRHRKCSALFISSAPRPGSTFLERWRPCRCMRYRLEASLLTIAAGVSMLRAGFGAGVRVWCWGRGWATAWVGMCEQRAGNGARGPCDSGESGPARGFLPMRQDTACFHVFGRVAAVFAGKQSNGGDGGRCSEQTGGE